MFSSFFIQQDNAPAGLAGVACDASMSQQLAHTKNEFTVMLFLRSPGVVSCVG
jgi:hypothetical protein